MTKRPRGSKLRRLIEDAWDRDILLSVTLELTHACNLRCAFCCTRGHAPSAELGFSEIEALLGDLAEMQVLTLVVTGGEPLVHPRFMDIGRLARSLGFVIRLKTNGFALTRERLRQIQRDVDPFVIELSLHGARPETHDRQTGVPGSFALLMTHLRDAKHAGLRVKLNTVLTRWNEDEVEPMMAIADQLGVAIAFDETVTPRHDHDRAPLKLSATAQGVRRLRAALAGSSRRPAAASLPDDNPRSRARYCGAGTSTVTVDPFGNVLPCSSWRTPVGNVRTSSLPAIWRTSATLRGARRANEAVQRSIGVKDRRQWHRGFCPGEALTEKGCSVYEEMGPEGQGPGSPLAGGAGEQTPAHASISSRHRILGRS